MDKYTALRSRTIVASADILKISAEAKKDNYENKIDASIGVFLNDDKTLNGVRLIKANIGKDIPNNLNYPPISGQPIYKEAVSKWLFREYYDKFTSSYSVPFCATLGGTGACFISFKTFLEKGEKVLLPSLMWNNYQLIASEAGIGFDTYEIFDSNQNFNIDNLIQKIKQYQKVQQNVLVVINDPCQNPTGYSLSSEEYQKLFVSLNEITKLGNITILFDVAYLDYDRADLSSHKLFKAINSFNPQFLCMFAFSCSKTFGMYGLRTGALLGLTKSEEVSVNIVNSACCIARGTYSCPTGSAIIAVSNSLLDNKARQDIENNILANMNILHLRGRHLIDTLDKYNIKHTKYSNGFFITLYINNSPLVTAKLKEKHMYVVPLDNSHIRLALSSLKDDEIDTLIYTMSEVIKTINE